MVTPLALRLLNSQKACLAMIIIQLWNSGMALLSKVALNEGMSYLVFVAYRQAIGTLVLVPFAYILDRPKAPPLSLAVFCKIFLLSLCGLTMSMDLYYMAFRHTSATLATTSINIIPVFSFAIAIVVRMETIDLRTNYGRFKMFGVVLGLGGVMVVIFYKGPSLSLFNWAYRHHAFRGHTSNYLVEGKQSSLIQGPLLMFAGTLIWSVWVVMQAKMLKIYPAKLRLTALQTLTSAIQSTIIAAVFERDVNSWRLGWDVQLLSVAYCGVFVTGISYGIQIWCIEKKGPFYVASFSPLSLPITAIFSALIWAELINLGSVLGGVLIVGGLYCVLWGKRKEASNARVENSEDNNGGPLKEQFRDVERA